LTLNDVVVAAVGVPLIAPVVALIDIHAGAPTSEYVYGVVPPPAVQLAPVYATFTCAVAGNVQFNVSVAGATTKLVTAKVAVCGVDALSVTFTLKDVVVAVVGVPLIAPVVALIDIQEGAPTSEYIYGVVPPAAVQLAPVYATFT
jgi:Asp/Glu/hydantoin racemase